MSIVFKTSNTDLRCTADANRAQDLEHCEHAVRVCVARHT